MTETLYQKTFKEPLSAVGVGIHSGAKTTITFRPAPANTGLIFRRTDVKNKNNEIPATYQYVVDTRMCSCFGNADGVTVSTAEHVMAALHAYGISNAYIEVTGPEIPIMDGSAKDFVFLFDCAGISEQRTPQKILKIKRNVKFDDGKGATVSLSPADSGLELSFDIEFPAKIIGHQACTVQFTPQTFKEQIAIARTFGMKEDIEKLWQIGLARGGSLENAILVDKDKIVNPEGLREPKEFVFHKVLDAVGDLYQAGMPIIGKFYGNKSGHFHTNALLKQVFSDKRNYEIIEAQSAKKD